LDDKRIIDGYEEKFNFQLDGRLVILAESAGADKPFLVCCARWDNPLGAEVYYDASVHSDYLEAVRKFIRQETVLLDALDLHRGLSSLPFQALTAADCVPGGMESDMKGKLVVVKPEVLSPEFRSAEHQLGVCRGGFGSRPDSSGTAVFIDSLFNGETSRFERYEIAGVADLTRLPEWAKVRLKELEPAAYDTQKLGQLISKERNSQADNDSQAELESRQVGANRNNKAQADPAPDVLNGVTMSAGEAKMEALLLSGNENRFGIYQVRDGGEARKYLFASTEELESQGLNINRDNYQLVYTAPFTDRIEYLSDRYPVLNKIFHDFNVERPDDFHGRSVSVSDIILLKWGGQTSAHFVDSFGFVEVDGFLNNDKAQSAAHETAPLDPFERHEIASAADLARHPEWAKAKMRDMEPASHNSQKTVAVNEGKSRQPSNGAQTKTAIKNKYAEARANADCAVSIDKAVQASYQGEYRYDLKAAVKMVTEEYGARRVAAVLAANLSGADYDGRFSSQNKAWARDFCGNLRDDVPTRVVLNTHRAILDGFVTRFREVYGELLNKKPSLYAVMDDAKQKAAVQNAGRPAIQPKSHKMENEH